MLIVPDFIINHFNNIPTFPQHYNYHQRSFQVKVDPSLSLSHHYRWICNIGRGATIIRFRICEFGGFSCTGNPSVVETRTHEWSSELLQNVRNVCNLIFEQEECPPAPPLGNPW